eukprot:Gb_20142 [translate_table: standard]
MIIHSPELEVKIMVERDPIKTSFEKWVKPGHFLRTLAKGPNTTTWIWNLQADAHDFDSHINDLEEISRKVFSAHFGQLAIILIWLSGMYFHGAHFSNYEAWMSDPTRIKPSAQVVWLIVGQEILNGDVALILFAGWFHYHKSVPKLAWFQDVKSMLNHHLAGLLGLGSLSWAGRQVHVSLLINQLLDVGVDPKEIPLPHEFISNHDLLAQLYPSFAKGLTPFFALNCSEYSKFLIFHGGLNLVTGGLWLIDTAHHHLAIAIIFLIVGHMYRTNWGIGHSLKEILEAHKGSFTGEGHKGIYEILTTSWNSQLSLNLAMLGSLTIIVAHHMYLMPPYPYLAIDYGTQLSLFTHHMWIGGFLIVGGHPQDMFSDTAIQLQPIFAQWIQKTHSSTPSSTSPSAATSTSLTWGGGDLLAVGGKVALLPIPLGIADILVHHIHEFTIHVTVLILLKGVLFSRSSSLIPDKANLGFRFPCDGPRRGGTCQVSAWDHVFMGLFWMYNAISVVIFHFSWKMQSNVWGSISDWEVELIESIIWAHNKLKVAPTIQPRALSIVQGHAVGVSHYLLDGITTTWAFFLARILADPTTHRIWFGIAIAHDFESHDDITEECLYQKIFASHFGQLVIIFLWTSGNLFHIAWQGNFKTWVHDLLHVIPIAHAIWDPHFGQLVVEAFTRGGAPDPVNIAYSGVYQWWYTIGLCTNEDLYTGALFLLFLSTIFLVAGLFGVSSLAWMGYLVHVTIPESRGGTSDGIISQMYYCIPKALYGFDVLLSSTNGPAFNVGQSIWLPGWLNAINDNSNSLFLTIGPGDFLVHHAIALGLHTTTLILVKGALDARGSKLMLDKKDFGYSFPCDGPGGGDTCDISACDAFYLAIFWMLNTVGWVTFYWHWKHITLWQGNVAQFNESFTYLM